MDVIELSTRQLLIEGDQVAEIWFRHRSETYEVYHRHTTNPEFLEQIQAYAAGYTDGKYRGVKSC